MDFKEQYRHPKWQKKRLDILKRDKFTCRSCGDKESTLNVHHRYYDKNKLLWEYKNDDLFTMCNDCHKYWHEELIGIKKVLPKNIRCSFRNQKTY